MFCYQTKLHLQGDMPLISTEQTLSCHKADFLLTLAWNGMHARWREPASLFLVSCLTFWPNTSHAARVILRRFLSFSPFVALSSLFSLTVPAIPRTFSLLASFVSSDLVLKIVGSEFAVDSCVLSLGHPISCPVDYVVSTRDSHNHKVPRQIWDIQLSGWGQVCSSFYLSRPRTHGRKCAALSLVLLPRHLRRACVRIFGILFSRFMFINNSHSCEVNVRNFSNYYYLTFGKKPRHR